jgi:hypothetical protein
MISSEVQRTLVKSPPELWAELSDPTALARHLGELGEIRILRMEPESTIEWAAENTTGTVSIKPSGWGTKVTLSVTRETAETAPSTETAPPAPTATGAPEPPVASEPQAVVEPEPETAGSDIEAEPDNDTTADASVEQPRRGFFARLFGRRRAAAQPDPFVAVRQALEPDTFAANHPFAVLPAPAPAPAAITLARVEAEPPAGGGREEPVDDISAELMAAEDIAAEQVSAEEVTAVLTAVLDRLGAAHHRPFSRS